MCGGCGGGGGGLRLRRSFSRREGEACFRSCVRFTRQLRRLGWVVVVAVEGDITRFWGYNAKSRQEQPGEDLEQDEPKQSNI